MSKVKFKSKMNAYSKVAAANLRNAELATGDLILQRARVLAPKLTGDLRSDGRVEKDKKVRVIFGDERVPYARRRHFENSKNPQTLRYLERAAQSVFDEGGVRKFLK